jgi:hypothetical protein
MKEITAVTKYDQNTIPFSSLNRHQIAASFSGGEISLNGNM